MPVFAVLQIRFLVFDDQKPSVPSVQMVAVRKDLRVVPGATVTIIVVARIEVKIDVPMRIVIIVVMMVIAGLRWRKAMVGDVGATGQPQ